MLEQHIELRDFDEERALFGARDHWRRFLHERFQVELVSRNGALKLLGVEPQLTTVRGMVEKALGALRSGSDASVLEQIFIDEPHANGNGHAARSTLDAVIAAPFTKGVRPRTAGQQRYVQSLRDHEITIVSGPAGSGKTFLAVASAVTALRRGEFKKLVLSRPAVEAGEHLGFLPGDLQAKVNPYLRPLYDALYALLEQSQVQRYVETDVIEVVPLAYMRGRTLEKSFIILDEAQNTTPQQMKMFLTRMGEGSRIVVTGDITQTDLPPGSISGLVHCRRILRDTPGIGFVDLDGSDIVRHPLVQRIVDAYERHEDDGARGAAERPRDGHPRRARRPR